MLKQYEECTRNAEINATANTKAKNKTAIWTDKIEVDTVYCIDVDLVSTIIIHEGMMGNFESWNSNFRNELVKRDCLDVIDYLIKYQLYQEDKFAVIANKNVTMFFKQSVKDNLWQLIEETTAFETYKDLVDMASDKISMMRAILAEVPYVCTIGMEAYVLEHQNIHSKLMKADPKRTTEASKHLLHMTRLIKGLAPEQQLNTSLFLARNTAVKHRQKM